MALKSLARVSAIQFSHWGSGRAWSGMLLFWWLWRCFGCMLLETRGNVLIMVYSTSCSAKFASVGVGYVGSACLKALQETLAVAPPCDV